MTKKQIDPFTLEIIKEGLMAIGDEMFVTMARTSMSTIIYEVLDYAVGLTDASGHLITQGNGVTLFLGTLDFGARSVLDKFGLENIKPGDIYITNDPYSGGGTHLSDVSIIAPIFYKGSLVAFAANKGHWTEVGGMAAGSWTTNSTEIYQEGLQFPCVKLFDQGQPIQSMLDIIRANVRTPNMSIGDMYAQVASMRIAEQRFQEMCDKYGVELVMSGIEALLDYGEDLTRQEIDKLPDGVYEAVDYIDDDGIGNGPFEVRVKITIEDDKMVCDYTGTHAQVPGPVNCSAHWLVFGGARHVDGAHRPGHPCQRRLLQGAGGHLPGRHYFHLQPSLTGIHLLGDHALRGRLDLEGYGARTARPSAGRALPERVRRSACRQSPGHG